MCSCVGDRAEAPPELKASCCKLVWEPATLLLHNTTQHSSLPLTCRQHNLQEQF